MHKVGQGWRRIVMPLPVNSMIQSQRICLLMKCEWTGEWQLENKKDVNSIICPPRQSVYSFWQKLRRLERVGKSPAELLSTALWFALKRHSPFWSSGADTKKELQFSLCSFQTQIQFTQQLDVLTLNLNAFSLHLSWNLKWAHLCPSLKHLCQVYVCVPVFVFWWGRFSTTFLVHTALWGSPVPYGDPIGGNNVGGC